MGTGVERMVKKVLTLRGGGGTLSDMTYCHISRQADEHADWIGMADEAEARYYGSVEETAGYKAWIAVYKDEYESGESALPDLSLATYRDDDKWMDDAIAILTGRDY